MFETALKLLNSELEELFDNGYVTLEDGLILERLETGNWIDDGKTQYAEVIFTDGKKYYKALMSRSGSYDSGYSYSSEYFEGLIYVEEVRRTHKTVLYWESV